MSISAKITLCAMAMSLCLIGCTYQRRVVLPPTGLPEEIYLTPQENKYFKSVAVFKFREPLYPPGMGRAAAELLYSELLRNKAFVSITLESDVSDIRLEGLMKIARQKDYDLIIMGDLLYYIEGSLHQPSRVDERIRVIDTRTNKTLWYAKAMDVAPPAPHTDYVIIGGQGAPAPTARVLLKRNAEKFYKMLINLPPQEFSAVAKSKKVAPGPVGLGSKMAPVAFRAQPPPEQSVAKRANVQEENGWEEFFNEQIYFEFDRWRLLPEAKEVLTRKAEWLKAHPDVSVVVEGHCDERGTSKYNLSLGHRRAESTRTYLVELGIAPKRLKPMSYGRERPVDRGHGEGAWTKNRRAEFLMEYKVGVKASAR